MIAPGTIQAAPSSLRLHGPGHLARPLSHLRGCPARPASAPRPGRGAHLSDRPARRSGRAGTADTYYDLTAVSGRTCLSVWKEFDQARWSFRINPFSGNLHPTEGYLVCGPVEGLHHQAAPGSTWSPWLERCLARTGPFLSAPLAPPRTPAGLRPPGAGTRTRPRLLRSRPCGIRQISTTIWPRRLHGFARPRAR